MSAVRIISHEDNQRALLNLLFQAAAQTLLQFGRNEQAVDLVRQREDIVEVESAREKVSSPRSPILPQEQGVEGMRRRA